MSFMIFYLRFKMKKIVCQLVVKDVVTLYVIDVEGRLYSTNGVRDGFAWC